MNQRLPEPVQPVATAPLTETQRFWFAHVERCHESGLSIAAYARQHLLADKSLYKPAKRPPMLNFDDTIRISKIGAYNEDYARQTFWWGIAYF